MTVDQTAPAAGLTAYVAAEIRAHLGRHAITRSELAHRLDVDDSWVGKRLNRRREISLTDLERIAAALGVPVATFLPRSGGLPAGVTGEKPRIDPLAPRVVATVGDTGRRQRNSHTVVIRDHPAIRTARQ